MYKTDIVTTGMQAITFLLKNPVDMVLLDYEMPVMDGPQVLQVLRQEGCNSQGHKCRRSCGSREPSIVAL